MQLVWCRLRRTGAGGRNQPSAKQSARLTQLQYFYVGQNEFTGSTPPLAGLTALESFVIFDNQIGGSIPALMGLSNLRVFAADSNPLIGSLPSLAGLNLLVGILLNNNQLGGNFPPAPIPNALVPGDSVLCDSGDSNHFERLAAPDWDVATGSVPWFRYCQSPPDAIFKDGFDS